MMEKNIARVGYIICAYFSCSQGSQEASAFIRAMGEPCILCPRVDRENKFCTILRVVLHISVLVVHGLGRNMRFGMSLMETT